MTSLPRAMPDGVFESEGKFFYLPFVATALFLAAYAMAIVRGKMPPLHARYMVCTMLSAVDPMVGRIVYFNFPPRESVDLPGDRIRRD